MARNNALEQYLIDHVSIPEYFNRFLANKEKGIAELHEETSTATLCPFHDDVNPSFRYWKPKRFFMCFGCGVSGDVINLHRLVLQRAARVKIARETAVKDLCRIYNIKYSNHSKGKKDAPELTVVEKVSVFERCRRATHLQTELVEQRKHFSFAMYKQQNTRIKDNSSLTAEERFKAFEELDFKASVAVNATDDHFDIDQEG